MNLKLTIPGGGWAHIETREGERVTVLSSRPSPPGSTLNLELPEGLPEAPPSKSLAVKVRGCQRVEDGQFRVQGRLVSLSKQLRLWLDEQRGSESPK